MAAIRIAILANATNAVAGMKKTADEAERTKRKLDAMLDKLDKLGSERVQARVDANTKIAEAKLAKLAAKKVNVKAELNTKGFAQGVAQMVSAHVIIARLRKGFPDLSFGAEAVARKIAVMGGAMLAATAATLPMVGAAVAMGAAFAAAGAAVGLFAAVAKPTIDAVTKAVTEYNAAGDAYDKAKAVGDTDAMTAALKKQEAALGALTPAQRDAAKAVIGMKKAWDTLSETAAPVVLGIIEKAASTLKDVIPKLKPAIDAVGKALTGVTGKGFDGLAKSIGPIVEFIKGQGAPAITTIGKLLGNLLPTVGHLITAFAPLGNQILKSLVPVTQAMRSFNFDGIVKAVTALMPTVMELFANVGGALGNLLKAAAPLAGPVLGALNTIAGTLKAVLGGPEFGTFAANVGKMLPAIAEIASKVLPVIAQVIAALSGQLVDLLPKLVPVIIQVAETFGDVVVGLSPLLPALVDVIGVLATFLPILAPVIVAVREAFLPVLEQIGQTLTDLQPSFKLIIGAFVALLKPMADLLVAVIPIVAILIDALAPVIVMIAELFGSLMTELAPVIKALIVGLKPVIEVVATFLTGLLTALKPVIPVLGTLILALAEGFMSVLKALVPIFPVVLDAIKQLAPVALELLEAVIPIIPELATMATTLIGALLPAMLKIVPIFVGLLEVVMPIVTVLVNIVTAIVGFVAGSKPLMLIVAAIVLIIKGWTIVQWLLNTALLANPIVLIVAGIIILIGIIVLIATKTTWFQTIWKVVWTYIKTVAMAVFNGLKAFFTTMFDFYKMLFMKGVAYFKAVWAGIGWLFSKVVAVLTGVKNFFVAAFNWVKAKILAFVTGLLVVWSRITGLATKVNDMKNRVLGYISGLVSRFLNLGKDMMRGLVDGIAAGIQWVKDKVKGLGGLIPGWLKSVLGIKSPSKVMAGLGAQVTDGLAQGITSRQTVLRKAMDRISNTVNTGFDPAAVSLLSGGNISVTGGATGAAASGVGATVINVNIAVAVGADPAEVGRQTVKAIRSYERQIGRPVLVAG